MASWHSKSCKRPDVYPTGDSCYCLACDMLAPLDQVVPDKIRSLPPLPQISDLGEIHMTWPKSVHYWNGINTPINSLTAGEEDIEKIETCQCSAGSDKISQPISSSTVSMQSKEVYKPLKHTKHFRLLQLSKGKFNDPIHGTLTVALLSSGIEFQALSYTWADETGDDSPSQRIFLGPRWDIFQVTANCKAALHRMRQEDRDTMVWVDAICIDQGNHTERNHQVGLMRNIYSAASEVFVYLGEGTSSSNEAFDKLMWAKKRQSSDIKGRGSLQEIFTMRYFYRIWVIQEIANAKSATINCGYNTVGWSILEEERLKVLGIYDLIPTWVSSVYTRQDLSRRDLPDLLLSTAMSKASDPRDKVFALFGLLKDADEAGLAADYSATLFEVEIGIAAFVITHEDDCSILTYARGSSPDFQLRVQIGAKTNRLEKIPSWVPIWDRRCLTYQIPRELKTFHGRIILKAEHVMPRILSSPITNGFSKAWINHIGGHLSILAIRLIKSPQQWAFLDQSRPSMLNNTYELCPGFLVTFEADPSKDDDEIVIFKGCETIFHIRRQLGQHTSTCKIIGACNILVSSEQANCNASMDLISAFILQHCYLKKSDLQNMITLEMELKQLGYWDNQKCPSLGNNISESMFMESVIGQAFASHINCGPELDSSDFKQDGTEYFHSIPITLQWQWLTTRLKFWDSHFRWDMIHTLSQIFPLWVDWSMKKSDFENYVLVNFSNGFNPTDLEEIVEGLADDIISLAGKFSQAVGMLGKEQCRFTIGEKNFVLLRPDSSGLVVATTADNILNAILEVLWQCEATHNSKKNFEVFLEIDNRKVFSKWDWSEVEEIFDPLKLLDPETNLGPTALSTQRITLDLQRTCASRMFISQLQPRAREWERITII